MKAVIAVLLLGVTLCGLSVVGVRAQGAAVTGQFVDEWRDLPYSGSPVSRFGHSFETIDTNMFLFGGIGYNPVPYLVGSTWKFNGLTDTFSNLGLAAPSAPSARVHHAAAVAGTSMFVFGGCTAINVGDLACTSRANDLWEFSSVTNSWAARPIDPTSPVPDARFGASAVTYTNTNGETFLVIYGGDSDGTTDDGVYFFEISDGETRFSVQAQTGTRPPQLAEHTAAVYGQYMYVHGGRLANSASTYQTALWRFDLDNFVWTELTSSTDARGGRALVVLDNFFFIFGGTNGGTLTNSLRVYDMEEEAWYTMATGMEARAFTAGGVLDGNVVFFSGMTGTGGGAGSVDGSFRRFFVRPVIDGLTPDSGGNCGGNEVTVSGEMFSAGSLRCTFGDQEVAATFISDTEVKCLAPAVAGDAYGHTDVQVGKVIGDVRLFTVGGGAGNDYEFVEDVSSPVFTEPIDISVGTAGDATTMDFVVQARTSCGTDRTTGGDTVVVDVLDATTLTSLGWAITSSDNGDGTYSFSFFTTAAATYRVEIHLNGAMLQNDMTLADEAFSLLIKAAAVDTVDSTIGTYDAGIIAGNTNQVRILAYDVYDNVVKDASGVAVVATSPEVQVTGTVTYDGVSLLGAVRLTRAGTYVLNVTADGVPVANSPQTIVVAPNVIDAASCTVEGFSTEIKTTAGTPVNLRLTARDVYGNQRNTGGAAFAASLSGTADVPATVSDNGDGTYGIAYEATRIGQYALSVTLGGVHIEDSPFATPVEVGTVVSAAGSYAYGENIGGGRAGTEAQFKIQTRDEWGNNMRTQDVPWEVEIPAAQQDSITIQDNENGRYTVFFTFKHLGYVGGTHEIAVKYEGEHIVGSPYEIDVTAGAWFFVIIVLVVIICAILIGVVGTWACHKVQKKVRYKLLWHDTSTIFPEAAGDHIPEAFSEEQQYMDPINPGTVFFDDMDDPTFDYTATRIIGGADLINSTVDMADVEGWDVPTGDIDAQGRDVGAH